MKADLYQDAIVAQAKQATGAGRLDAPDASITLDNPLCGDRVTIDVKLAGGRIAAMAHRVRGCLLCEASASVVGANAIGQSAETLVAAQRNLRASLEGPSTNNGLWPGMEAFAPVAGYKSRHACVLLPLEALLKAVNAAPDWRIGMIARGLRIPGWPAIAMAILLGAAPLHAQDQPVADPLQEGARAYSQRDFSRALRHWAPLAQRGDGAAQYNLGRMYARGEGVQRDLQEAYKWFTLAAVAGRPEGDRARQTLSRSMTPVQMAEGLRRAEEWRQRRR